LGYYLVRVHQFLLSIGMKPENIRFRQHLENEKAHYAKDCWDAELQCSYGWIECVGNADRACYDLGVHARASGYTMTAFINYPDGPQDVDFIEVTVDKKVIGQTYKGRSKDFLKFIEDIKEDQDELELIEQDFLANNVLNCKGIELTGDMINFTRTKKTVVGRKVRPSVIEPSFGIGRIIYCLLEQSFNQRQEEEARMVLTLKPFIAPIQCCILPLQNNERFDPYIEKIGNILRQAHISNHQDTSGVSIGRRYARVDEIGCPFCITIDFQTTEDETVTIRERDTTTQIRVSITDIARILSSLIEEESTWDELKIIYPLVQIVE